MFRRKFQRRKRIFLTPTLNIYIIKKKEAVLGEIWVPKGRKKNRMFLAALAEFLANIYHIKRAKEQDKYSTNFRNLTL